MIEQLWKPLGKVLQVFFRLVLPICGHSLRVLALRSRCPATDSSVTAFFSHLRWRKMMVNTGSLHNKRWNRSWDDHFKVKRIRRDTHLNDNDFRHIQASTFDHRLKHLKESVNDSFDSLSCLSETESIELQWNRNTLSFDEQSIKLDTSIVVSQLPHLPGIARLSMTV